MTVRIHKKYVDGATKIYGAEFRGAFDFLRAVGKAGLVSLTNPDLAKPTKSGSVINLGAFTDGDGILTGGLMCHEFNVASIDFTTAAPGGGALAAGTYTLYLAADEGGTAGDRRPAASPRLTDKSGAWDVHDPAHPDAYATGTPNADRPDVYLVLLEGIVWDGANITSAFPNQAAWKAMTFWGVTPLTSAARGNFEQIVIGDERQLLLEDLSIDTLDVRVIDVADDGWLFLGTDSTVWGHDGANFHFWGASGHQVHFYDGGADINLYMASQLTLGDNSVITLSGTNSRIVVGAASEIDVDGVVNFENAGALVAKSGGIVQFDDGAKVYFGDQEFTGIPGVGRVYGAMMPRAIAKVGFNGTLVWGFNVDSITKVGTGEYKVNFKRSLGAGGHHGAQVTLHTQSEAINDCEISAVALPLADYVYVGIAKHTVIAGAHALAAEDQDFMVVVWGGELQP